MRSSAGICTVSALRLLASPLQDALVQHSHGIDDLRIARQRLGLRIGLGGMQACLAQGRRRRALVDERDRDESEPGGDER